MTRSAAGFAEAGGSAGDCPLWVYRTIAQLEEDMRQLASENPIARARRNLEKWGFIRAEQPGGTDRTWHFLVRAGNVERALRGFFADRSWREIASGSTQPIALPEHDFAMVDDALLSICTIESAGGTRPDPVSAALLDLILHGCEQRQLELEEEEAIEEVDSLRAGRWEESRLWRRFAAPELALELQGLCQQKALRRRLRRLVELGFLAEPRQEGTDRAQRYLALPHSIEAALSMRSICGIEAVDLRDGAGRSEESMRPGSGMQVDKQRPASGQDAASSTSQQPFNQPDNSVSPKNTNTEGRSTESSSVIPLPTVRSLDAEESARYRTAVKRLRKKGLPEEAAAQIEDGFEPSELPRMALLAARRWSRDAGTGLYVRSEGGDVAVRWLLAATLAERCAAGEGRLPQGSFAAAHDLADLDLHNREERFKEVAAWLQGSGPLALPEIDRINNAYVISQVARAVARRMTAGAPIIASGECSLEELADVLPDAKGEAKRGKGTQLGRDLRRYCTAVDLIADFEETERTA